MAEKSAKKHTHKTEKLTGKKPHDKKAPKNKKAAAAAPESVEAAEQVPALVLGQDCKYMGELKKLQIELVKLQEWIKHEGLRVVVLFEGRDAAGKGGAIKRITESLNPRVCRVVALGTPTEREKTQWYFQRYVNHLPAAGEMILFDRSWYNRAGVERVMGFCTEEQYQEFMQSCPEFERMLIRSGILLIKYWFSVSDAEQEKRFQDRMNKPTKRWKISPMDLESRKHWADYSRAKDEMFAITDTKQSPWYVVNAEDKEAARLNVIRHLLSKISYHDLTPEHLELPPLVKTKYVRPPIHEQNFIPQIYQEEAVPKPGKHKEKDTED
ncbi:polyphosphate kinase 2 [Telmatobacter bradus]|uniref:polyphosphate kinase 2 n=1 Tax=Telmatobacter bradus TaxID=474953 RepID=UPI003B43ADB0